MNAYLITALFDALERAAKHEDLKAIDEIHKFIHERIACLEEKKKALNMALSYYKEQHELTKSPSEQVDSFDRCRRISTEIREVSAHLRGFKGLF